MRVLNIYAQFLPEDDPATVCYPLSLSAMVQNRAKFKPEPWSQQTITQILSAFYYRL